MRYATNKNVFKIDTNALLETPGQTEIYSEIGGLESFDPSFDDQLQTSYFLDNSGFASNDITGQDITITFSGKRTYGDVAQDAIVAVILDVERRKTSIEWDLPGSNGTFTIPCVITDITPGGGATTDLDEFSFTIRLDGTPVFA